MRIPVVACLALSFCLSCASGPPVTADGLTLRRVVIYRNGVAYFEREGHVTGNRVSFRVRRDEISDFLASFAVMEKDGSSVRAASFPLHREADAQPPVEPLKAGAVPDPKRKLETVVMELDGGEHDLSVGYIAESPVWRPSYRLVLQKDKVHLQVWGIVQNLSGEDWPHTRLSVVADAPLALQTQLETSLIPSRPVLAEGNEVMAVVPQSETTLAQAPPEPAPAPAAAMAMEEQAKAAPSPAKKARMGQRAPGSAGGLARAFGGAANIADFDSGAAPMQVSRVRNMAALAAVAVSGGATRYDLPNPVTVPDGNATMLLLLDREVAGESAFLFAPDAGMPDSTAHPFRVARFTNQTGGLLERGPLAFYGESGFLGQGVIDGLPEGASATVPFAIEQSLAIERNVEYIQEGARLFQVEGGQLTIERQVGPRTHYKIKSGGAEPAKLWLKHARQSGSKLVSPPKDTEDNVGSALVPTHVQPRATVEIVIDERQGQRQGEDWLSNLAELAVKQFLGAGHGDSATVSALRAAFGLRNDWKKLTDEGNRLRLEQQGIERATDETRDNLRSIEKNKAADDLRKTLTGRLAKASARLDVVLKRLVEVDMQGKELELRFREAIKDIHVPAQS